MAWQTKKLGEVGNIFSGNSINAKIKKDKYLGLEEGIPYIATKDISYNRKIDYNNGVKIPENESDNFRIAHKNSILICAEGGSAGRKLAFNIRDVCFVNKLFAFEPEDFMEPKFIYYFYQSKGFQKKFNSRMTGLIGGVSIIKFKNIDISFPPLKEQKEIVKILDEVLESISQSKENAEKNLKNAKELFESHLEEIFSNPKEDWEEKKLGEVCNLSAGGDVPKDNFSKIITEEYKVPIFSNGINGKGLYGYTNIEKVTAPSITISARGTIGYSEIRREPFYPVIRLVVVTPKNKILNLAFLKYVISRINFIKSGTSIPQLTVPMVRKYKVHFPKSIPEQKTIVKKLDALSKEIKELESIYNKKVEDFDELKKSMLQKAFNGELTRK